MRIHDDAEMSEIIKFAATSAEEQALTSNQHIYLLYEYRNALVHEFREPGYDFGNLGDDPTPYYMDIQNEQGAHHWDLGYPAPFFALLAERALLNLKAHCEKNGIDPYTAYEFGSRWRRK